jgi:hypothetical protein
MHRNLCILVPCIAALAGCSGARPAAPAAAAPPTPPADIIGTWTAPGGAGFIAIGLRQVVIAVDGAPRITAPTAENGIEPGMSAGRLVLGDGTVLFIAKGTSEVDGLPIDHLDVEVVAPQAPATRRRVLSDEALRLSSRMAAAKPVADRTASVRPAPADQPSQPAEHPDRRFEREAPASRRSLATHLIERAAAGATAAELGALVAQRQRTAYAAALVLVEQALNQHGPEAAARSTEAERLAQTCSAFATAWHRWMADRG